MTTNVPPIVWGPTGPVAPAESDILAGITADINSAFGGGVNPALNTPQGQLASSEASIVGSVNDTFLYYANQVDPAFSSGRMQDALGRIYNLARIPSAPTVLTVQCFGLTDVSIPVGALITDDTNIYSCTGSGSILASGSVTLSFAAQVDGPIGVPSAGGITIYQAIPGWDNVVCISGVVGNDVESRAQFEERRQATIGANAAGTLPSILGAVLEVTDVIDAYVTDNTSSGTATVGGTALVPKSLYVAAVGGLDADVANAIWRKKPPGAAYNGNTTVTVQDTSIGYSPPFPSYTVKFQRPTALPVLFQVNIVNSAQVPADALLQIQNALLSAFAGGDGGARARIGSTLYSTRYVNPITALGAWAQVASILVGSENTPTSQDTASITGSVLTVTAAAGTIAVGQTVQSGGTGVILPGTKIISLGTGVGGTGTYNLNISQGYPSGPINTTTPNQSSVVVKINQVPTLAAADISVSLV